MAQKTYNLTYARIGSTSLNSGDALTQVRVNQITAPSSSYDIGIGGKTYDSPYYVNAALIRLSALNTPSGIPAKCTITSAKIFWEFTSVDYSAATTHVFCPCGNFSASTNGTNLPQLLSAGESSINIPKGSASYLNNSAYAVDGKFVYDITPTIQACVNNNLNCIYVYNPVVGQNRKYLARNCTVVIEYDDIPVITGASTTTDTNNDTIIAKGAVFTASATGASGKTLYYRYIIKDTVNNYTVDSGWTTSTTYTLTGDHLFINVNAKVYVSYSNATTQVEGTYAVRNYILSGYGAYPPTIDVTAVSSSEVYKTVVSGLNIVAKTNVPMTLISAFNAILKGLNRPVYKFVVNNVEIQDVVIGATTKVGSVYTTQVIVPLSAFTSPSTLSISASSGILNTYAPIVNKYTIIPYTPPTFNWENNPQPRSYTVGEQVSVGGTITTPEAVTIVSKSISKFIDGVQVVPSISGQTSETITLSSSYTGKSIYWVVSCVDNFGESYTWTSNTITVQASTNVVSGLVINRTIPDIRGYYNDTLNGYPINYIDGRGAEVSTQVKFNKLSGMQYEYLVFRKVSNSQNTIISYETDVATMTTQMGALGYTKITPTTISNDVVEDALPTSSNHYLHYAVYTVQGTTCSAGGATAVAYIITEDVPAPSSVNAVLKNGVITTTSGVYISAPTLPEYNKPSDIRFEFEVYNFGVNVNTVYSPIGTIISQNTPLIGQLYNGMVDGGRVQIKCATVDRFGQKSTQVISPEYTSQAELVVPRIDGCGTRTVYNTSDNGYKFKPTVGIRFYNTGTDSASFKFQLANSTTVIETFTSQQVAPARYGTLTPSITDVWARFNTKLVVGVQYFILVEITRGSTKLTSTRKLGENSIMIVVEPYPAVIDNKISVDGHVKMNNLINETCKNYSVANRCNYVPSGIIPGDTEISSTQVLRVPSISGYSEPLGINLFHPNPTWETNKIDNPNTEIEVSPNSSVTFDRKVAWNKRASKFFIGSKIRIVGTGTKQCTFTLTFMVNSIIITSLPIVLDMTDAYTSSSQVFEWLDEIVDNSSEQWLKNQCTGIAITVSSNTDVVISDCTLTVDEAPYEPFTTYTYLQTVSGGSELAWVRNAYNTLKQLRDDLNGRYMGASIVATNPTLDTSVFTEGTIIQAQNINNSIDTIFSYQEKF